ncbi:hypothetical protein ESA94_16415 [Lacibacter luteus]|uniref:Uncharacterized protein n=1 Tax=Lacibacter luteus TaxID=2508719 RepID=A0A4Q1CGB2_9BACT|nr:hypothetical protein [Lacibacter luteus]RXK58967.1 hypothetical protein ESA94_16415 [Lacibacter luteus]
MLTNQDIKQQLLSELNKTITEFKEADPSQNHLLQLEKLLEYDFESYKEIVKNEIRGNLKSYWTNHENGINPEQKLDAILFEHYVPDSVNLKAVAYGIIDWSKEAVDNIEIDMGHGYDFAEGFEQVEGLTLDFFNPYVNFYESDENLQLAHCYRLKGTIAIHEAFYELNQTNEFDCINKNDDFYFLLGEHDSFCYAVLSISSARGLV